MRTPVVENVIIKIKMFRNNFLYGIIYESSTCLKIFHNKLGAKFEDYIPGRTTLQLHRNVYCTTARNQKVYVTIENCREVCELFAYVCYFRTTAIKVLKWGLQNGSFFWRSNNIAFFKFQMLSLSYELFWKQ